MQEILRGRIESKKTGGEREREREKVRRRGKGDRKRNGEEV